MMLHAQDKGSVALETLLIMLPYARLEEHRLCFDCKNRQFFPFFANSKDNLLLSPQKINLTAYFRAKISDYLLLSVKYSDLTADNRKKMRFFAISI
jgi:hypothetical protein